MPLRLPPQTTEHVPRTEQDVSDFAAIRHAYVPEIIVAYNSALHSAAHCLTRNYLVQALELSAVIAAEENAELADCFVKTGRMGELVTAFALDSKTLLVLNERRVKEAKKSKREEKKKKGGSTLDIWDVSKTN